MRSVLPKLVLASVNAADHATRHRPDIRGTQSGGIASATAKGNPAAHGTTNMGVRSQLIAVLLVLTILPGCSSNSVVELQPVNSTQALQAKFSRAYFAPSESGEDRIILLSDPIDDPTDAAPGDALSPSTGPPLWQVLYIELHWRSSAAPRADTLVASNAVVHWYVYGKPESTRMGALHYVGTGSVEVSADTTGANVALNNIGLTLLDQHGDLRDPFHVFGITTRFRAKLDPAHVREALSDVEKAIAEADHPNQTSTQP